ncbi:MAG: sulfate ABC transporter substrate-binding protein, partial [bacterium]
AAWGFALRKYGDAKKAREFVTKLYQNVPVLDSGARGSTTTFVERGVGDVLITWENEAFLATKALGQGQFEMVYPSVSVLAEPAVTWVDQNDSQHGTADLARAYLKYLYSPAGQQVAAQNFYRPSDKRVAARFAFQFSKIKLFTVDRMFGGWGKVESTFFADGGVFDQIYQTK